MPSPSPPTSPDGPPERPDLTDFDRAHLRAYLRLLDAEAAGADWRQAAQVVLGLDVEADLARARLIHDRYLARARWMAEHGYRQLLRRPAPRT
jgi:hypothetical protein